MLDDKDRAFVAYIVEVRNILDRDNGRLGVTATALHQRSVDCAKLLHIYVSRLLSEFKHKPPLPLFFDAQRCAAIASDIIGTVMAITDYKMSKKAREKYRRVKTMVAEIKYCIQKYYTYKDKGEKLCQQYEQLLAINQK